MLFSFLFGKLGEKHATWRVDVEIRIMDDWRAGEFIAVGLSHM